MELRWQKNGRPLLVGHRGAMAVAPGNTMPSFQAALSGGADLIELDVQLTADGEVVVFHDNLLELKTDASGPVSAQTAAFLQRLDVGSHFSPAFVGTPMPLLGEVLEWAKPTPLGLLIELKHGPIFAAKEEQLETAVVDLVQAVGLQERVVFISFDHFALRRIKQLNPSLTTSLMYGARLINPLDLLREVQADGFSPFTDYLTPQTVRHIQQAGYFCTPGGFWWDYPTLLRWGVDTISSNNPAAVDLPRLLADLPPQPA